MYLVASVRPLCVCLSVLKFEVKGCQYLSESFACLSVIRGGGHVQKISQMRSISF